MEDLLAQVPLLLLVSSRIGGMTAAAPLFSNRFMPTQARVAFTFLLALLVLPVAQAAGTTADAGRGAGFILACLAELIVGLIIGFLSQLVFAAIQIAGTLLDLDLGLAMAQMLNPVSGHSEPLLGSFFHTLALVIYVSLNAHHGLLRGLADSYRAVPPGTLAAVAAGPVHVVLFFGAMLSAAVKMVLPFMGAMLLTTMAFAGMNRASAQLNIFALGMGLKTVAGVLLLLVILPFFHSFLESLFELGQLELLRTLPLFR